MNALPERGRTWPIFAAAAFAALAFSVALSTLYVRGVDNPVTNPTDLRAFYCGGEALARGRDPYRVEPLAACERAVLASNGLRADGDHILPAPFPPYAMLAFSALSLLPFRVATQLWLGLDVAALGLAIAGASLLSGLRPVVAATTLLLALGYASLVIGQLVPIVVAALVWAALCVRREQWLGAAIGLGIAALEPHLALPAWLGVALFLPRSRAYVAGCAAALGAASIALGSRLNLEYAVEVLPQHARSELYNFPAQYGLPPLLAKLGIPPNVALPAGTVSYAVMLAFGLWLGFALAKRFGDPAFVIAAPVTAVLAGGPFLHGHQLAAAVPFALLLIARTRATLSRPVLAAALAALVALAIPWESICEMPPIADRLPVRNHAFAARPALPAFRPDDSAEEKYTAFIDAFAERSDARSFEMQLATKLPTWYALAVIIAIGVVTVRRSPVVRVA